jgi:Ca2+-binding RTX toxin-like protein
MIPGYVLGDLSLGRDTTMTSRTTRRTLAALGLAAAVTGTALVSAPSAQAAGTITVTFRHGALTVAGNDSANRIELVRRASGRIVVRADSRIVHRGGVPTVRNVEVIRVSTYGGNDVVRIRPGLRGVTVSAGNGADRVVGGSGADELRGGTGNDALFGGGGNDTLLGATGNDRLEGQGGHDRVLGDGGDDVLAAHAGRDILRGGTGDDAYHFDGALAGRHLLVEQAGEGTDEVRFFGPTGITLDLSATTYQQASGALSVRLSSGGAFENLHGGWGDDTLTGNALANELNGGEGKALLTGGAGADLIVAGDGGDFGIHTLADFADEDAIDLVTGFVSSGMGTSFVVVTTDDHDLGAFDGGSHMFVPADFL